MGGRVSMTLPHTVLGQGPLDVKLIPFYGLGFLYGYSRYLGLHTSVTSAILKAAPLWYLVYYIGIIKQRPNSERQDSEREAGSPYRQFIAWGLVLSSVGDAFLVFPATFLHGVLAFASAHLLYIQGLRARYERSFYARVVFPICVVICPLILMALESSLLAMAIIGYNLVLTTMLYFAVSVYESSPSPSSLMAACGAFLFVLSDCLLAFSMWMSPSSYDSEIYVMILYYLAQLLLALSVL